VACYHRQLRGIGRRSYYHRAGIWALHATATSKTGGRDGRESLEVHGGAVLLTAKYLVAPAQMARRSDLRSKWKAHYDLGSLGFSVADPGATTRADSILIDPVLQSWEHGRRWDFPAVAWPLAGLVFESKFGKSKFSDKTNTQADYRLYVILGDGALFLNVSLSRTRAAAC